jgi:hypothetical protein
MSAVHRWTKEGSDEALRMFRKAVEIDPYFASAYGMAVRCCSQRKAGSWTADREQDVAEVEQLALRAARLGVDDAVALCTAGIGFGVRCGRNRERGDPYRSCSHAQPNAVAWLFSGWVNVWGGQLDVAIEHDARGICPGGVEGLRKAGLPE